MQVSIVAVYAVVTILGSNFVFSNGQESNQNSDVSSKTNECPKNDPTPEALKCEILKISAAKTEKLSQYRTAIDDVLYSVYNLPENVTSDPFEKFDTFKQKFKQMKEIGDKSEKDKFSSFEDMFSTVDSFVKQLKAKGTMSNETLEKYNPVLQTVVNEILRGIPQGGNALTTEQKLIKEMYRLIGITGSANCLL